MDQRDKRRKRLRRGRVRTFVSIRPSYYWLWNHNRKQLRINAPCTSLPSRERRLYWNNVQQTRTGAAAGKIYNPRNVLQKLPSATGHVLTPVNPPVIDNRSSDGENRLSPCSVRTTRERRVFLHYVWYKPTVPRARAPTLSIPEGISGGQRSLICRLLIDHG